MNADAEFEAWRAAWQGAAPEPAASPAAARAADRRYRALAVAEYGVGALLLAGSLAYAVRAGDGTSWAWAATLWALTLPALAITVRLRRGLWQSPDVSVRGFLDLEIRRRRQVLRATRYGYGLLALTVGTNGVWILVTARSAPDAAQRMLAGTIALAALIGIGLALYARHARRGLDALESLARGLDATP